MFFGLIIVIVGIALLLKNMGIIGVEVLNIVWPSVLIIIGLKFMLKKHGHWHNNWCCGQESKK